MRTNYYTSHRLYRKDEQYWTFRMRWEAQNLGDLELQIQAFEAGLMIAGATKLSVDAIEFHYTAKGNEVVEFTDPNFVQTIKTFLGLSRKRLPEPKQQEEQSNEN